MGAPEQPKCRDKSRRATPGHECGKPIIGKRQPRCKKVQDRQQNTAEADQYEQSTLKSVNSSQRLLVGLRLAVINAANRDVNGKCHDEEQIPTIKMHEVCIEI